VYFRKKFDVFMLGEPYHSLTLLVNYTTKEFLFRYVYLTDTDQWDS
jgi:hypothetical protein